ncbi:MAG: lipopolysaccharide core heptose(I) kinase RfaP [Proteobacteria bacterium]|jgi:heptose I phosphotransferase|nr:lipopolysaccharide core heptose(I) kinase RfaP [Pseudomonadota bacterium]MDA1299924.1 lipopolysaccharide core heptose(I) kinase RfaP [Pseudomonadota bacterium]
MEFIADEYKGLFEPGCILEDVSGAGGDVYRALENRQTVRFTRHGTRYFAKTHLGVGWAEIFKNLMQLRLPVLGAENEFRAIRALAEMGIDTATLVAYTSKGLNPARRRSCIVTRALENTASLEELFEAGRVSVSYKRRLLPKLAGIARMMHDHGINHRDFYLCHFLVDPARPVAPYLIDLHRAQIRARTPRRWRVKDIGGLFFSGFDYNITKRDVFRFMALYSGKPLRRTLQEDKPFWQAVFRRACRLYLQDHARLPAWVIGMAPL